MNTYKGIALVPVLLGIAVLFVIAGGAYVVAHPNTASAPTVATSTEAAHVQTAPGDHLEEDHGANEGIQADTNASISWKLTDMDYDANNTPHTEVTAVVNGKEYVTGTFAGSCKEVGVAGGIDGTGVVAGELSAVQCWFAGTGDEVGVFAHEDGGYQIMVGELNEPSDAGKVMLRGNFRVQTDIPR